MSFEPTAREDVREVTWAWWLLLALGGLGVIAGVIVLIRPSNSLATLAVITGIFVLIDSIAELVVSVFAGAVQPQLSWACSESSSAYC